MPADARVEVRDLGDLGRRDLDPVDVRLAALVGHEVDELGIGRPLGVDVLAVGEGQQLLDLARFYVHEGQLVMAGIDPLEVGREALGDEGDGLAVGGPGGLEIGVDVAGHLLEDVVAEVVDEEVRDAAGQAGEDEVAAVRRERRAQDLGHLPEGDLPDDLVLGHVDDGQDRAALGHAAEDEPLPGRVPRARRLDELDALEVRVDGGRDDLALDLARVRVGQEEVDREQVPRREEDQGLAVGADGRRDVVGVRLDALEQGLGELVDRLGLIQDRPVGVLHGLVPIGRELFHLDAQHALENDLVVAGPADRLHHLADDLVAPTPGDIGPDGLAPAVGEVLVGVVELLERGQLLAPDGVAHPHRGVRVDGPDGQVFGHALDEPEGNAQGGVVAPGLVGMALGHDVVLEGVDELVADDVVGLGERRAVGQDDAALERLREAARALAEHLLGDRRLLELGAAAVEDEGLAALELVVEHPGQPGVPALGHEAGHLDRGLVLEVVVDVVVPGLHDLEVEILVLDLVPSVPLGAEVRRADGQDEAGQAQGNQDLG